MRFASRAAAVSISCCLPAVAAPTLLNGLTLNGGMLDLSGGTTVNNGRVGYFSDLYYDPFVSSSGGYPTVAPVAARSTTRRAFNASAWT